MADSIVHLGCGVGSLSLFNTKREGDRASGEGQGVVEVAATTSLRERAVYWMVGIALVVLVNKALDFGRSLQCAMALSTGMIGNPEMLLADTGLVQGSSHVVFAFYRSTNPLAYPEPHPIS